MTAASLIFAVVTAASLIFTVVIALLAISAATTVPSAILAAVIAPSAIFTVVTASDANLSYVILHVAIEVVAALIVQAVPSYSQVLPPEVKRSLVVGESGKLIAIMPNSHFLYPQLFLYIYNRQQSLHLCVMLLSLRRQ